jgi:hypothetical protein
MASLPFITSSEWESLSNVDWVSRLRGSKHQSFLAVWLDSDEAEGADVSARPASGSYAEGSATEP